MQGLLKRTPRGRGGYIGGMDPSRAGGGTDGGHIVQRRLRFMPARDNGRKEPLFDLIRSLTKAEKRNFKLYATRQGDANAKFIVLFDAMEAMVSTTNKTDETVRHYQKPDSQYKSPPIQADIGECEAYRC